MKSAFALSLLAGAAALISGCITGGGGGIPVSTLSTEHVVGPYTVADGKIITQSRVETSYECSGDSLNTYMDTIPAESVAYELNGNTLKLRFGHIDTLASGAIVEISINAEREGSGSGLEGQWIYHQFQTVVVSGNPTAQELQNLAKNDSSTNAMLIYTTYHVRFANGTLSTFLDSRTAEKFIADWNGRSPDSPTNADSSRYDVALRVISKYMVELKGNKTGETVTLTIDNDENRTYTSSVAGHAEYHYLANAKTCPNDREPVWYNDFLNANLKVKILGPKKGAMPKSAQKPKSWAIFGPSL